jgi:hydroxymethylbilane synthase
LVSRLEVDLMDLPEGARVGTSSLRRQAQLLNVRPDFEIVDIRGNIDTRLRKSDTEEYDGIILASAGLIRMGWEERIQESISCDLMTPAVGQGALGIETRAQDSETHEVLSFLNDDVSARAVNAERRFLAGMGGGCQTPMGAYCRVREQDVIFKAFSADDDGSNLRRAEITGDLSEVNAMADQLVSQLSH